MNDGDRDDLDALFAAAAPPAPHPADVAVRARLRLRAIRRARSLTALALLDLLALALLAVLAVNLGQAATTNGLPALARVAATDRGFVLEQRGTVAEAVSTGLPWLTVLALALTGLVIYALTALLLRATDAVLAGARRRGER